MYLNLNGLWLTQDKPETFCQAYHAGQIYSMVENYLPDEKIPPMSVCIQNFPALRELFGERLWQKLKSRSKFRARINIYEQLTYQPGLPKSMIGSHREFCLGYAYNHKRTKSKSVIDKIRRQDIPKILEYLHSFNST